MEFTEIQKLLEEVKFRDWIFYLGYTEGSMYLQVQFYDKDIHTGIIEKQHGRKWTISKFMISDEIIRTAYAAVELANIHEIRENFLYKNENIFGPHLSIESLVEIAHNRKFRAEM